MIKPTIATAIEITKLLSLVLQGSPQNTLEDPREQQTPTTSANGCPPAINYTPTASATGKGYSRRN